MNVPAIEEDKYTSYEGTDEAGTPQGWSPVHRVRLSMPVNLGVKSNPRSRFHVCFNNDTPQIPKVIRICTLTRATDKENDQE